MRASGYCSKGIEKAEEQFKLQELAQEVIKQVQSAFAGVTLEDGVGLRQARAQDDHCSDEECAKARALDEKDDWQAIPIDDLCNLNDTFHFFDAKGKRFHLPAFMVAELKGEWGFGLDSLLTHNLTPKYFGALNTEQCAAVCSVLEFLLDDPDCSHSVTKIQIALKDYWRIRANH